MTIQFNEKQLLAVKVHAPKILRTLGVKSLDEYEPHKEEWSKLTAHGIAAKKLARGFVDLINKETSEEDASQMEAAFEALIDITDACEIEKDQRTEIGTRSPRKHGGDNRRPVGQDMCANGADGFSRSVNEASVGLRPEQRMADHVRDQGCEDIGLSTGQYLRAMVIGAKTDTERRALSEGTDSAGGFTVPDVLSANLIDLMRARSVTIQAGARTVPLGSDTNYIAKLLTDPTPGWRAESAAIAESDPTFGRVTLTPKALAVLVKVSRELLEDSLNIETELPRIMTVALAQELDRVALFGSGTGSEPTGIVNTSGVSEVAHDATLTTYAPLITARTNVLTSNAERLSAYIIHPRDEGELAGLTDSTGQPLQAPPKLSDIPMLTTTSVPTDGGTGSDESSIITGDFSRLLIGVRSQISIQMLKERYADTGQYGFLAFMRADIAVEHPEVFCKITGINPTP